MSGRLRNLKCEAAVTVSVCAVPPPAPARMEARLALLCLCVGTLCIAVLGQVGSLCRPNERLLQCGCPKTCKYPAPNCGAVCVEGCFCNEGEVRNATGHCVKLSDCPPLEDPFKEETTEPRSDKDCPINEEYRLCEPCNKTCDDPNPMCPAQCARGCFCKDGLVRDTDGSCIQYTNCSKFNIDDSINQVSPIPYQLKCNLYQAYKNCETCERTCSDPNPKCPTPCKRGCFCSKDYVKAPDGQCVKLEHCPQAAEVSMAYVQAPSVEDCASDEEFYTCGWCEPSCSEPAPSCPRMCTTGCLCRSPLLRHHSGHCVQLKDCTPQKCLSSSEEYTCRYGCEPRCDGRRCTFRPRRCTLGCHCKLGLLRDVLNGECVTWDKCTNTTQPRPLL